MFAHMAFLYLVLIVSFMAGLDHVPVVAAPGPRTRDRGVSLGFRRSSRYPSVDAVAADVKGDAGADSEDGDEQPMLAEPKDGFGIALMPRRALVDAKESPGLLVVPNNLSTTCSNNGQMGLSYSSGIRILTRFSSSPLTSAMYSFQMTLKNSGPVLYMTVT